jgi:hemolysin-activating ACP:hemolysin acyltransferase
MKSYANLFDEPNAATIKSCAHIGIAVQLMSLNERHQAFPLAYLNAIVEQAMKHGYLKIYYDFRGDPVGLIIWAYVAEDVEERFLSTGFWKLHVSEWNEGNSLWIVDFICKSGMAMTVLRKFASEFLHDAPYVRYFRVNDCGVVTCKEYNLDKRRRNRL